MNKNSTNYSDCQFLLAYGNYLSVFILYYINSEDANSGLKVNRSIDFSCIKMFFASYFLFSLRLFKFLKEKAKQYKQKTSPKSCKTEVKILDNPGLA